MMNIIKTFRGLLVLMALTTPFAAQAETCRFETTGRIILTPAQLNPNVSPLKEAVRNRSGKPYSVDLKVLVPLIYERNIACARLPNGGVRPGWETPEVLLQAIADLNAGGGTNLNWISFAQRIQSSGFRLPGFTPTKAAAPQKTRTSKKTKPRTPSASRVPRSCGLCSAKGLN